MGGISDMKQREGLARVSIVLLVVWFLLTPFFWRFEVTFVSAEYYDAFYMAPLAFVHLLIFFILVFVNLLFNRVSLLVLLLIGFYFPFIQIANYPYFTIRDVYLHAGPAQTVIDQGQIIYPKDLAPESWPTSFNLHAVLSILTGVDVITANYFLYLGFSFIFILTLFAFVKNLEKRGFKTAGYSAILFLGLFFNHLFDNFHHYSRTTVSFTFLFLFFFVFFFVKDRRGMFLQAFFVIAIITTHPFQSIALLVFVSSYFILDYKNRSTQFLLLFSILAFLIWSTFFARLPVAEGLSRISTFLTPKYMEPIAQGLGSSQVLPWWGTLLRDFFKYSIVSLLGLGALGGVFFVFQKRRNNENKQIFVGLISFLMMSFVILLFLLLLPDWHLSRYTSFAAFPAAFTAFVLIKNMKFGKKFDLVIRNMKRYSKIIMICLLFFVITLSAVVMTMRFERNSYSGELNHPSELAALSFFFDKDMNSTVTIVSWRTTVYSSFFNYNGTHEVLRLWYQDLTGLGGNSTALLLAQTRLIDQSESVIRGLRDEFDFHQFDNAENVLKTMDETYILPKFNKVYSNGYYDAYTRTRLP